MTNTTFDDEMVGARPFWLNARTWWLGCASLAPDHVLGTNPVAGATMAIAW